MARQTLEQAVAHGFSWLETWRNGGGYGGPVVHYWNDSFTYIGPRRDWRIEGLMGAFLNLHSRVKKNADHSLWLNRAIDLGEHVLSHQREDGAYLFSEFEETPSFWHAAQPHESAVNNGLLLLAETLHSQNNALGKKFMDAAQKNVDGVLIPRFWNSAEKTLQQYQRGQFDKAPNLFVPNKIATAIETLVRLSKMTENDSYLHYAEDAAQMILSHQASDDDAAGGIFQSNEKEKIITLYTARCVRPLVLLYQETRQKTFARAAKNAAAYVARMQNDSGGFDFGSLRDGSRITFPRFVAGSGEMMLAFSSVDSFEKEKKFAREWLLAHQHANGGFSTFEGIAQKNTLETKERFHSWKDELPVVGWNDKVLRALSEDVTRAISPEETSREWSQACDDGVIEENTTILRIRGKHSHVFRKNALFEDSPLNPARSMLLQLGKQSFPGARTVGGIGFRALLK